MSKYNVGDIVNWGDGDKIVYKVASEKNSVISLDGFGGTWDFNENDKDVVVVKKATYTNVTPIEIIPQFTKVQHKDGRIGVVVDYAKDECLYGVVFAINNNLPHFEYLSATGITLVRHHDLTVIK